MMAPHANSQIARSSRSFVLVITLVMVALLAIIAVGVFTSTSLERATAKSYDNRYQAELAVQSGLEAFKKTLVASPGPSPAAITGTDTFLVVRADNGSATYYYLAQPTDISQQSTSSVGSSAIKYYPLYSTAAPSPTPQSIDLTATPAPKLPPLPAPTPGSSSEAVQKKSDGTVTKRFPTLYPWQQPTTTSGPSVDWVQMRDAGNNPLPYRYAYWAEDLDGYLDASQVGNENGAGNTQQRSNGTNPNEIALFTIFDASNPTDSGNTLAKNLIDNRALLFTVPTLQQVAPPPSGQTDSTQPNLAVRLGMDNNPGEQNLVPLGYGYTGEGQAKTNLNATISGVRGGNPLASPNFLDTALPAFGNRSSGNAVFNYTPNLAANIVDYASPQSAPTDFNPPGNPFHQPNSYRGIGAYPFVVSVYDLNNWVYNYQASGKHSSGTYHVVVEVKTFVQLWNPHNITIPVGGSGTLTVQYTDSDQISLNGTSLGTLSSPADATVNFVTSAPSDPYQPVITSSLSKSSRVNRSFSYTITATVPNQYQPMQPNSYLVVVLPPPTISSFGASGLPLGLTVTPEGAISGTPTQTGTYNVTISAMNSDGTTGSATVVITITP